MEPWLILSDPRCGGTVLRQTLDRHPDLECDGELFNPNIPGGRIIPEGEWSAAFSDAFQQSSGWHLQRYVFPYHSGAWDTLATWPGLRIIDLRRELTTQYLSWKLASVVDSWHERKMPSDPIPWDEREYCRITQNWHDARKRIGYRLANVPTLRVDFQELTNDFASVINRCLDFLAVERSALRPSMPRLENIDYRTVFSGLPADIQSILSQQS